MFLGSHYSSRTFYVFLYTNYIGIQGEDLSIVKVANATDRSKAVVLVWFLVYVAL